CPTWRNSSRYCSEGSSLVWVDWGDNRIIPIGRLPSCSIMGTIITGPGFPSNSLPPLQWGASMLEASPSLLSSLASATFRIPTGFPYFPTQPVIPSPGAYPSSPTLAFNFSLLVLFKMNCFLLSSHRNTEQAVSQIRRGVSRTI